MDATTLGAAIALMKAMPDKSIAQALDAANRAEAAAAALDALGLTVENGKLCVTVERK